MRPATRDDPVVEYSTPFRGQPQTEIRQCKDFSSNSNKVGETAPGLDLEQAQYFKRTTMLNGAVGP